ncbi:MAG TPA: family 78 glycoside hydrolase catalytic domain [Bacilli bacterium]
MKALCLWHPTVSRTENSYVAFQCRFQLQQNENMNVKLFGSGLYRFYLDSMELMEGPARYDNQHPEYDELVLDISAGVHVLTVVTHHIGVATRLMEQNPIPFIQIEITYENGALFPVNWQCKEVDAYLHIPRRLSDLLGWMECCDMRLGADFPEILANTDWMDPMEVNPQLGERKPKSIRSCISNYIQAEKLAEGRYTNRFGYENDDPPVRFMLRDLCPNISEEGIWLRFDMGRIGLYRPFVDVSVPEGTVIEMGYSDRLTDGRVYPFVSLSASTSCFMDRWIAKSGKQRIQPFSTRGFRYLEIHIGVVKESIQIHETGAVQRSYFPLPGSSTLGTFHCDDELLNKIWQAGVNTMHACSEDALVDTPVRERGQWVGDAVTSGMDSLHISFGDLSLVRRGLLQASYCSREDGLAAALHPCQMTYIGSFSLLWIMGCMRYCRLTGETDILYSVYDTAKKTVESFLASLTPFGVVDISDWDFIDWGHMLEKDSINVSLNLFLYGALKEISQWEQIIGLNTQDIRMEQIHSLAEIIKRNFGLKGGLLARELSIVADGGVQTRKSSEPGYHANVLGLWFDLFEPAEIPGVVQFIKNHMLNCFPNNLEAPRLAHPGANHSQLITPYFAHFSLHVLAEKGEMSFVLDQYRICWGWMLQIESMTLLEVFDARWSHCHGWSSCPTWQLSRHVLGLIPDDTVNQYGFTWNPKVANLRYASGTLPLNQGQDNVQIEWTAEKGQMSYSLKSTAPLNIKLNLRVWEIQLLKTDGSAISQRKNEYLGIRNLSIVGKQL